MRRRILSGVLLFAVCGLLIASTGCRTTTHHSIRIYESDTEPQPTEQQQREGQWEMVSPGEMESPGTMIIDP